jgi:hypothetical protein
VAIYRIDSNNLFGLAIKPRRRKSTSIAFARIEALDAVIDEVSLNVETIPKDALFLAGKIFLNYQRVEETKHNVRRHALANPHARCRPLPLPQRKIALKPRRHCR